MTRTTFAGPAILLLASLSADRALAQVVGTRPGGLPPGPAVSPYLNLLRTGNSPALNYYGLVRPQFQTNASLQALQQQFALSQSRPLLGSGPADDVLITGHSAVFMNYGGYFQSATGGLQSAGLTTPTAVRAAAAPRAAARLPGPR